MTPLKVKQKLFEVRDVIHDLHLNTDSYSTHKALNEMYDSWTALMDTFLETFYGKYGRIKGIISIDSNTDFSLNKYLTDLIIFLNVDIILCFDENIDTELQNIVADMKQLVNHTMYLLTLK